MNNTMKVREVIHEVRFEDNPPIRMKDFKPDFELQDDDIIEIHVDEGYYSENNSWDPFTRVFIIREREQTAEEKAEFKAALDKMKEKNKKERHKLYLDLKKEFENETIS